VSVKACSVASGHGTGFAILAVAVFAALSIVPAPGRAQEAVLSGAEIRNAIAGHRVYLHVPLGEFPLHYRANGEVDGSGQAVGLGRFMRPTDSGRWWIDGDKLCQRWQSWYKGRRFCFTLKRTATGLSWRRDDGLAGTARIGD
jgi:hypothetical protein